MPKRYGAIRCASAPPPSRTPARRVDGIPGAGVAATRTARVRRAAVALTGLVAVPGAVATTDGADVPVDLAGGPGAVQRTRRAAAIAVGGVAIVTPFAVALDAVATRDREVD